MTTPADISLGSDDDAFRTLTAALQVGVVVHGPDARILYANPKAAELLGLTEDQLLGRSSFHPDWHFTDETGHRLDPSEYPAVRTLRDHRPLRDLVVGVYRPITHDRIWVMARADAVLDADGNLRQVIVSFSDITALKTAEAAHELAHREAEQFRRALDQVPAYVFIKDTTGRYTYGNAPTLELFGVTAAELHGSPDERFFPPEAVERLHAIDRRVLAGEQTREEVVVTRPDGQRQVYIEVKSPLMAGGSGSAPVGILGISIDISELRRLEESLEQANRLESIGRLAGGVAHDFNNMLGVILGRAELALAGVDPASSAHADLTEILVAARRSAELTKHLLAFARKQAVLPRRVDLATEVAREQKLLQRLLTEDIPLEWSPEGTIWPVHLDPTQLDQILVNLCVNARDAIHAARAESSDVVRRDAVTIRARNVQLDADFCARHGGGPSGDFVALSVSDTGCGIPPELHTSIFEPFFTTKPMGEGTGLGLATVFGTTRQAGGYVTVDSEVGHGTTFTVYLPRDPEPDSDGGREVPKTPAATGGRETILVVEDEPGLLLLSAKALQRLGYTVLTAPDVGTAMSLAETHRGSIDLLLTDVLMPGMDGRELAGVIRRDDPKVMILFMSGFTGEAVADGTSDAALTHFLAKPFTLDELAHAVRARLDAPD